MKKNLLTLWLACLGAARFAQRGTINIAGIHQLVDQSISENKLQVIAKDEQVLATANEQANLTLLTKLKSVYRTIQQRYNTLGTAINVANIGIYASPMVSRIIGNQAQVIELVRNNPALAAIGYESALQFADKANSLLRYVTGLTLAIGDVNQMKSSDRKLLFDYVLYELSVIQDLSGKMLSMMQYSSLNALLRAANPFQHFIDADRKIAGEIIRNARYLRK